MSVTPEGVTTLIAVGTNWEPESLRLVQLAVKLTGMQSYGAGRQPYQINVVCYDQEPPESVVAVVRRIGGAITRENSEPAVGRPGVFGATANGDLDWPAIQAANAALFAQRHGLPGTLDSLRDLDALLADAFEAAADGRDPDDEDDDIPEDGDLAILAGAYASEVMLAAFGGRWLPPIDDSALPSFRICVGPDGQIEVGAAGKVRKFLANGPGDAVHPLARVVAERM